MQSCGSHLLVLNIFSLDNYASVAGTIKQAIKFSSYKKLSKMPCTFDVLILSQR